MKIIHKKISSLKPYERNAKTHPEDQVKKIAGSISEFGFLIPILIDDQNIIIAGHGRYEAAKMLKLETVPTIRATGLTESQIKAFRIADNRLAESPWDDEALQEELRALLEGGFDIALTGFDMENITGDSADALEKTILAEPEVTTEADHTEIKAQITDRLMEIAATDPQRFEKAEAIVLPLKKGSRECFVICDPNTADTIAELRRYAAAGEKSPLDCLLKSVFSMKPTPETEAD